MSLGSTLATEDRRAERQSFPLRATPPKMREALTPRLAQLAGLLARGAAYKSCADAMGLAESSIKVMSHQIYVRLGVSGRDELQFHWMGQEFQVWLSKHGGELSAEALNALVAIFPQTESTAERWLA